MVALRITPLGDHDFTPLAAARDRTAAGDWLTIEQSACELGVSASTIRRRIRKGELRNRIVPHKAGFAYRVYLPNSRHSRNALSEHVAASAPNVSPGLPDELSERRRRHESAAVNTDDSEEVGRLRDEVDRLSEALARTLRLRQTALPAGMGRPEDQRETPYAQYRQLVRKRRWWLF